MRKMYYVNTNYEKEEDVDPCFKTELVKMQISTIPGSNSFIIKYKDSDTCNGIILRN
jgi:hypothetical protein